MQARLQQSQNGQQPGLPNGTPQQRPVPTNVPLQNGTPTTGQNLTVPGQNRARGPLPAQMAGQVPMQNGLRVPQPMMNGVPQAQMQGMQGQLPLPNPALDVGLVTQAHRISEQQRQAIQMRQSGQMNGQVHNSPPRAMNGMSPPSFPMQNGAMMPFPNANGVSSPGGGPNSNQGQAGSPRMGQPQQPNPMLPQAQRIEEQIRQKYPNASQDQVMRMVTEHITKSMHQRQVSANAQSAMNAAAGGNMGMLNGMGMNGMPNVRLPSGAENSPQMYAQMLRQQQENQQKAQAQAQAAANTSNGQNGGQGHQRSGSSTSGN
jgi:chromatin modification-related protein VID21